MPTGTNASALPPLTWWSTMRWATVEPYLPEDREISIVEFGCGLGAYGARFASMYRMYTGIEPDATSAEVARARVTPFGGEVRGEVGGLPPASVDLICAFEVLEHLEDDRGALVEWVRAAAPGALVIVSVPAEPDRFGEWDEKVGHYRRYSREGMTELLRSVDLEPIEVRQYGYPFGYALETARNLIARRQVAAARNAPMEARTESSGRQRQATNRWMGTLRRYLTMPFRRWQARHPHRGPGLVAVARVTV